MVRRLERRAIGGMRRIALLDGKKGGVGRKTLYLYTMLVLEGLHLV